MRDVTTSFATTALIQIANIATGLLAARLLGPEGRGELAEIMLWPSLLVELGLLGLSDALLYRAATAAARARELAGAMAALAAVQSALLVAIGLPLVWLLMSDAPPELRGLALLFVAGYVPINLFSLYVASAFQGQLDLMAWNRLRALVTFGYLGFILAALTIGQASVAGFAAANLLGTTLSLAIGLVWLARRGWIGGPARWSEMKALVVYGAKVHVGEMLHSARQRLDQAVVALWLSSVDLGLYVVALTLANGPMILVYTLANVAFPKISQQQDDAGKAEVLGRYLRFTLAIALCAGAALFVLAEWLVAFLFGAAFAPAGAIVRILLAGLVPYALKLMFMQALKAWDRSLAIGRAEALGLVAAAGALVTLLPRFGIEGAAWSLVIAQFVACVAMGLTMRRHLSLSLRKLLRPSADDLARLRTLMRWPPA